MMAIEDHGIPLELGSSDIARLQHVVHIAVAIVVVADVFLIKIRQRTHFVGRAQILAVPGNHFVLPIRVECWP